jgi:UDP-N-acetylmuramoyl-L-alanyl-D-glutamate--2,6-diaminopimelate ligase
MMLPFSELVTHIPGVQGVWARPQDATVVTQVTADSRTVTPGSLFVAVKGGAVDGHAYLTDAVQRGAAAACGAYSPAELADLGYTLPDGFPYAQVENGRVALAYAAAALAGFPSRALTVIGVTGTDGKTTTSTLIESILNAATRRAPGDRGAVGVITTVAARIRGQEVDTGLHVTTPDAPEVQHFLAQMRDTGCRYAVVESTSHGLHQGRVAAVDFDIAAVTNITHEHLDYHGTREAYVQAKALLFRALYATPGKPGVARCAVLNADDVGSYGALLEVLAAEAHHRGYALPVRAYGLAADRAAAQESLTDGGLDVVATEVRYAPQQTSFTLLSREGGFAITTPLIGEFNVYNILCAAAVALALGITPEQIQQGVAEMQGVSGRMERIDAGQEFLAVVDFAHSPASLERALHTLRPLVGRGPDGQPGRLIAVFGCAGLRDRAKRGQMGEISGRLSDFTVITAEDPRTEDLDAINAAIAAGVRAASPVAPFSIIPDRTEAIQAAVAMARAGDVVAAFGKGHERSMCFGTVESPWSDQDAMAGALQDRQARRGATREN